MDIFKYTSVDSAIRIVKSGTVLLNNPKRFNDPFDCKIEINEKNNKNDMLLPSSKYYFKIFDPLGVTCL